MKQIPKLNYMKRAQQLNLDLMRLIQNGYFSPENKLPPEEDLAKSLGVSRALLREVLGHLEQEGYIIRRKKHGTFINQRVLSLQSRLDIEQEFFTLLSEAGYENPSVGFFETQKSKADDTVAKALEGTLGEPIYIIKKLILANQQPLIYCEDYFLESMIQNTNFTNDVFKKPIFGFFENHCQREVTFNVSKVKGILPDTILQKHFKIDSNHPLLKLEEVSYDDNQEPILLAYEYYNQEYIDFYLFKKKY